MFCSGFVSFNAFEINDLGIECMHNHYLCNRQITVQYAFNTGDGNDMVARGGKDRGTYWKGMVVMPSAC